MTFKLIALILTAWAFLAWKFKAQTRAKIKPTEKTLSLFVDLAKSLRLHYANTPKNQKKSVFENVDRVEQPRDEKGRFTRVYEMNENERWEKVLYLDPDLTPTELKEIIEKRRKI